MASRQLFIRALLGLAACLVAGCVYHADRLEEASATMTETISLGPVEQIASGFISTEGPVWDAAAGKLYFTDIPADTIYALDPETNAVSALRSPSNTSNGLALDNDGALLAAEQQTRIISRMDLATREVTPFIESYEEDGVARKFNSPNDMTVHPNGTIYFTDPPFGLRGREDERELSFNGFFMRTPDGEVHLVKSFEIGTNPNGVILSPDSKTLYLNISNDVSGPVLAFDVAGDGSLSNERVFASGQNNDGLAIDTDGTLYVATRTGIQIWSSSGEDLGKITLPDEARTTNCAFGGPDMKTLYITSRTPHLYAVRLDAVGYK